MEYLFSAITVLIPGIMFFISFNSKGIIKVNAKKKTKKVVETQEQMDKKISKLFLQGAIILSIIALIGNVSLYSLGHADYTLILLILIEVLVMIYYAMLVMRIIEANKNHDK